jgi:hypothetical protein
MTEAPSRRDLFFRREAPLRGVARRLAPGDPELRAAI